MNIIDNIKRTLNENDEDKLYHPDDGERVEYAQTTNNPSHLRVMLTDPNVHVIREAFSNPATPTSAIKDFIMKAPADHLQRVLRGQTKNLNNLHNITNDTEIANRILKDPKITNTFIAGDASSLPYSFIKKAHDNVTDNNDSWHTEAAYYKHNNTHPNELHTFFKNLQNGSTSIGFQSHVITNIIDNLDHVDNASQRIKMLIHNTPLLHKPRIVEQLTNRHTNSLDQEDVKHLLNQKQAVNTSFGNIAAAKLLTNRNLSNDYLKHYEDIVRNDYKNNTDSSYDHPYAHGVLGNPNVSQDLMRMAVNRYPHHVHANELRLLAQNPSAPDDILRDLLHHSSSNIHYYANEQLTNRKNKKL